VGLAAAAATYERSKSFATATAPSPIYATDQDEAHTTTTTSVTNKDGVNSGIGSGGKGTEGNNPWSGDGDLIVGPMPWRIQVLISYQIRL
jgi:hypothetical protein